MPGREVEDQEPNQPLQGVRHRNGPQFTTGGSFRQDARGRTEQLGQFFIRLWGLVIVEHLPFDDGPQQQRAAGR